MAKLNIEELEKKVAKKKALQYMMKMRSLPIKITQRVEKAIGEGSDAIRLSREEYNMIIESVNGTGSDFYREMVIKSYDEYCTLQFRNFEKEGYCPLDFRDSEKKIPLYKYVYLVMAFLILTHIGLYVFRG